MACGKIASTRLVNNDNSPQSIAHDWGLGSSFSEDFFDHVYFLFPKGHRFPKGAALTPEQAIKDAKFWGLKCMEILKPGDTNKIIVERI